MQGAHLLIFFITRLVSEELLSGFDLGQNNGAVVNLVPPPGHLTIFSAARLVSEGLLNRLDYIDKCIK